MDPASLSLRRRDPSANVSSDSLVKPVRRQNTGAEVDLSKENPVQIAALLKMFFRELPDPLMTTKLCKLWVASQSKLTTKLSRDLTCTDETEISDDNKRRRVLHLTCCLIPKAQRDTMEVLFTFLAWASSFCQVDEESGTQSECRKNDLTGETYAGMRMSIVVDAAPIAIPA